MTQEQHQRTLHAAQQRHGTPTGGVQAGQSLLNPANILKFNIDPALMLLEATGIPPSDEARVMMLAIAGQESNWEYRLQQGGPARSLWQFEKGGGVDGVFRLCGDQINSVCYMLGIPCNNTTVFEAMAWNNVLGATMCRLLLFTDAAPLPEIGDVQAGWNYYLRNWRPGMPHPEVWPDRYQVAMSTVAEHKPLQPR